MCGCRGCRTRELEKIETQWADNRKVIKRLGGVLCAELDDGLLAWKKGVRRPGWERVQACESDGILVWHTDRLFRQPRDLETLIALGDKGFQVASAHGARDLADPDDRVPTCDVTRPKRAVTRRYAGSECGMPRLI
jgi:site-specific DNA recombinase